MIEAAVVRDYKKIKFSLSHVQQIVRFVCGKEKQTSAFLSFVFIGDKKMKLMNKKFLNHNFTTDVITFPLETDFVHAEIYINVVQAKRQAKEFGAALKDEMIRLIVHGTLHSLGYDDSTPADKKAMFERQERYVDKLSLLLKR